MAAARTLILHEIKQEEEEDTEASQDSTEKTAPGSGVKQKSTGECQQERPSP